MAALQKGARSRTAASLACPVAFAPGVSGRRSGRDAGRLRTQHASLDHLVSSQRNCGTTAPSAWRAAGPATPLDPYATSAAEGPGRGGAVSHDPRCGGVGAGAFWDGLYLLGNALTVCALAPQEEAAAFGGGQGGAAAADDVEKGGLVEALQACGVRAAQCVVWADAMRVGLYGQVR